MTIVIPNVSGTPYLNVTMGFGVNSPSLRLLHRQVQLVSRHRAVLDEAVVPPEAFAEINTHRLGGRQC